MLSSVPAVVQTQHGEVILARATPLFLVCDMMLGGNLSCARKKRKRIASHNLKKTQHEASILGRFMLGNDDTQKGSTSNVLQFETTSKHQQVSHFTAFSCLGPHVHTHLWCPFASGAPESLTSILRFNLEGSGPRCQSTRVVPSLELELLMCCDEFGLWPRKRNGFEKCEKGSRCKTWHRRMPNAD